MENAAAALVESVLQDPTATSATKLYQFAQLCNETSPNEFSNELGRSAGAALPFPHDFCKKLDSTGSAVGSDAALCEWWQQQALHSSEQAEHRKLVGPFLKHVMSEALVNGTSALEEDSDAVLADCADCAECEAALQESAEQLPEPEGFPPAPRRLRPVSLEALKKQVTTQEVMTALKRIAAHGSLSSEMRRDASRILDRSSAVSNFATAVAAMLESSGGLWQWGEGAALPPHRHVVHGLKKCRVFSEPSAVLMMTFLEVFTDRLLSEVSKSLNPLQRWRHKHEVKGSTSMMHAALACSQRHPPGPGPVDVSPPWWGGQSACSQRHPPGLQLRVDNLTAARLQLRQRFDFPLSQGFCYDGAGDGFGKLFVGLRVEIEVCRALFCSMKPQQKAKDKCGSASDDSSDELVPDFLTDLGLAPNDFELVPENLTVVKADLRCCAKTMPHSLMLHCLKLLGLSPEWLAFFRLYLEIPQPSGKREKRGMPLGPSLSTLLLEIVGSFLDLWFHTSLLQQSKARKATEQKLPGKLHKTADPWAVVPASPVLASLRCGDDLWLITRTADVANVWTRFKNLYSNCGLVLNLEDSGSVSLGAAAVAAAELDPALEQRPCWSLLQLTPDCTWRVAGWRLAPRVSRALEEVQTQKLSLLHRIKVFNRHVDSLLRQGGFHSELHEALQPLHLCIASLFQKAVENGPKPPITLASKTLEENGVFKLLSTLLWWPRQSGGLGARHLSISLHGEGNQHAPLLPVKLSTEQPLEAHVRSALQAAMPRNDRYDSHLRTLFGPLIQDSFGTTTVLDSRYAALLG